jgi:divalent metal cation (Fe/Co/Zn/Cd) transporter
VLNWQLPLLIQQIAIAPEVLNRLACEVEGVNHCYRIRSKGIVGRQMVIEMNLVVQPEFISMAQAIARQVEDLIRERYGPVYAIIHIDQYMPKPRRSPRPPYRPKKHL